MFNLSWCDICLERWTTKYQWWVDIRKIITYETRGDLLKICSREHRI